MKYYSNLLTYKLKIVRVAEMLDGASRVADCNQLQFAHAEELAMSTRTGKTDEDSQHGRQACPLTSLARASGYRPAILGLCENESFAAQTRL